MRKEKQYENHHVTSCTTETEDDINFVVCQRFEKQRRLNTYTFGQIEPILLRHRELGHFDLNKAHAFIEKRKEREAQEQAEFEEANCQPKGLLQLMKMVFLRDK